MTNGVLSSSQYRKYIIAHHVKGAIDDVKSHKQVFQRRLEEMKKTKQIPDLIIIDGGKPQLSGVMEQLQEEKRKAQSQEEKQFLDALQIIALAKKEEWIFHPSRKNPIILSKSDPALKILQLLRDEAHRFAITFHRKKREQTYLTSALEEVPGL